MPVLSATTTWRTHPYFAKGYLYIHKPPVVFKARVNQGSFNYPLLEVAYNTVTVGAYTDVVENMLVLFGSAEGLDDLGRQRVRVIPNSTKLFIGWSSRGTRDGEVNLANGAYITVLDDRRVWQRTPRFLEDGTALKDGTILPGNFPQKQPPVANAGVGYAQFVDPITEVITVIFPKDGFAVADGATITDHDFDVADGTVTDEDSTTITVEFPPGFRYVRYTVTDSNSNTAFTDVPVFAAEKTGANAPITKFSIRRNLAVSGQEVSIELKTPLDPGVYPDGTLVMYWQEEHYDSTVGSLAGPSGRQHMKFIGWHHNDPHSLAASETGLDKRLSFNCLDVAGKLATLPGFPQIIERKAAATKWQEMKGADMNRYIHYLLYWHSTALMVAPYSDAAIGHLYPFPALDSAGSSLYDQGDNRAEAIAHRLTCDSKGQLALKPDPIVQEVVDRTSVVIVTLEDRDYTDIRYTYMRPAKVHWLDGAAIQTSEVDASTPNSIVPYFSLAPGRAPGSGVSSQNKNYQLVRSQTELNNRTGHQYERLNAVYSPPTLSLTHAGDAGLEPAHMEWVRLDQDITDLRLRRFVNQRCLLVQVSYTHDNDTGLSSQEITIEPETVGTSGITIIPDVYDFPAYDGYAVYPVVDWGTGDPVIEEVAEETGITEGEMGIGYTWNTAGQLGYTTRFTSEFVDWFNALGTITGTFVEGTGHWTGTVLQVWILTVSGTTARVYSNLDAVTTPDDWTLDETFTLTGTSPNHPRIKMSQSADLILVAWKTHEGIKYNRRWNGTWGGATASGNTGTDSAHDADDLGLAIDGQKQVISGQGAAGEYKLFMADGNVGFAIVGNAPAYNDGPPECIVPDRVDSIYASMKELIPVQTVNLFDSDDVIVGTPDATITPCDGDTSEGVTVTTATMFAGIIDPEDAAFGGVCGEIDLDLVFTLPNQPQCTAASTTFQIAFYKHNSGAIDLGELPASTTCTLKVEDEDGNIYTHTETIVPADFSAPAGGGSVFISTATKNLGAGLFPGTKRLVSAQLLCSTDFTGGVATCYRCVVTFSSTDVTYAAQTFRRLYRISAYTGGAAVWTNVTPTGGYIPTHHEGLAVDALNANRVSVLGINLDGDKHLFHSNSQGNSWTDFGEELRYNWLKRASSLFVAGGADVLDLTTDTFDTTEDRRGNWEEGLGPFGTNDGAILLFEG